MSIASEITRLQGVKSDILTAIGDKGVTVPTGSALDDCPALIADIPSGPNYKVIGGKEYRTVVMPDGKEWLAENLDFKFCEIGHIGTRPTYSAAWYYDNDETTYGWNGYKCGLLYNWYAVELLNANRSDLCPGWHVPTSTEWSSLITACGGAATAGKKLKASNLPWATSWNGSDDYGFSLLPAGGRYSSFLYVTLLNGLWTSTEDPTIKAFFELVEVTDNINLQSTDKETGFSLRLVRDT